MIYEIRTYDISPRFVPEYQSRFHSKLAGRQKFSKLFGHWYTEVGPLNQIVAIWPYENPSHRSKIRAIAEQSGTWPPDTGGLVSSMNSRIFMPAPFMSNNGPQDCGPIFELRVYTYQPELIPTVLSRWEDAIEERTKLSPMVGCWYSDSGGEGNFVHMWGYRSFEDRIRIRSEAINAGIWPPANMSAPDRQENKILLPASFSPIQ